MVRIRSEHAIGFLKGRFKSLKGLRVKIIDERTHKFATYWVIACIAVHSMQCKEEEEYDDSDDDSFIAEGRSVASSDNNEPDQVPIHDNTQHLTAARQFREKLKADLFEAKRLRNEQQEMQFFGDTRE